MDQIIWIKSLDRFNKHGTVPPIDKNGLLFERVFRVLIFTLSGVAGFKDVTPRARVKGVRVLKLFRLAREGGVHELSGY